MRRVGFAILGSAFLVATAVAAAWPTSPKTAVVTLTEPAGKASSTAQLGEQTAQKATSKPKAPSARKCKLGELTLKATECPKGAHCRAACVVKPKNGPSLLCPEGRVWKALPCPKNARCLVGGRCVAAPEPALTAPATSKTTDSKVKTKAPTKVQVDAPTKLKCKFGRVPTRVQCVRAPCDTLCLPARFDPSLKASPKVKAL